MFACLLLGSVLLFASRAFFPVVRLFCGMVFVVLLAGINILVYCLLEEKHFLSSLFLPYAFELIYFKFFDDYRRIGSF
jgi:hypothetical protein